MSLPAPPRPKAVLAGLQLPGTSDEEHRGSLAELGRLVQTLGYEVIGTVSQRRHSPSAHSILGEGKLKELARFTGGTGIVASKVPGTKKKGEDGGGEEGTDGGAGGGDEDGADAGGEGAVPPDERAQVVVFDMELTPNQLRNLETATDAEVLDRTGVIVEIFHRHAHTREARAQVEIARLRYVAPRLRMTRRRADRQGGGIGAKGVGETSHELDRRRIRDRIAELTRELEEIHGGQQGRRERRREQAKVALVGYTNAGKSSLMRALTGSEVLVEDKLFATLDTTIRALHPETVPRILASDTVGFIRKLPHDLVASFRSTLDEAADASLLLFVVDASDPDFRAQLRVTREVLGEIGALDAPSRVVLNKMDRVDPGTAAALGEEFPDAFPMSAKDPGDVARLRGFIVEFFEKDMAEVDLFVPYTAGPVVGEVRRTMRVLAEDYGDLGTTFRVRASPEALARIERRIGGAGEGGAA
ncbi:GTPase HflX [Myxococcota bacterium]|nr:GTPase HflX [Myxococcota bacterium]